MSAIEPQNYEAVPLGDKWAWVTGQPGLRAVEAAADSVRTMGERLAAITTDAGTSMRGLGVSWAGPASEAAQRSSQQIVDRAADTQSLAANGADRILDYGHSFDEMRSRIQFEDPSQLSWVELSLEPSKYVRDMFVGGEDHVSVLRRDQEYDKAANHALRWHEVNARAADDGFVTDGSPPRAVPIGAAAIGSEPGGGGGAGVGSASSAPPAVSAAAAAPSAPAVTAPPATSPPAPPSAGPAPATGSGPAGPAAVPLPGAPGSSGSGPPGYGPPGYGTGSVTGAGATGAAGAAGAGGAPGARGTATPADPAQERARRAEQFRQDLAARSPAAAGSGPGGRPPAGNGAANRLGNGWNPAGSTGRPPSTDGIGTRSGTGPGGWRAGGWGATGPDGRSPLPGSIGGTGSRPGGGAGAWRAGGLGEPGGFGGSRGLGGPGGPPVPGERLPGEIGNRSWSRAPGMPGEGTLARPVAGEAVTGRGAGYGPGYAPMMGGAGGLRSDGDAHRNRYLLPTSEPFDVDLPHAPPVLAPEEDG